LATLSFKLAHKTAVSHGLLITVSCPVAAERLVHSATAQSLLAGTSVKTMVGQAQT